jgi:hypothetical protein
MLENLVEKLKSCSPAEREETAMELASIVDESAVQTLIYMAGGNIKHEKQEITGREKRWKRKWYFLGWKQDGYVDVVETKQFYFDIEDQLIAIRALAATADTQAYNYLMNLTEYSFDPETQSYRYHNIKGKLGDYINSRLKNKQLDKTHGEFGNSAEMLPDCPQSRVIIDAQRKIEEKFHQG